MPTTIEVNKQSVEALLGSGRENHLLFQNTNVPMLGQMSKSKHS